MPRDSKSKLESWSETVVNFVTIIETIERIAVSKTNKKIHYISSIYVSHIHTQSVYILVFEAMDPD